MCLCWGLHEKRLQSLSTLTTNERILPAEVLLVSPELLCGSATFSRIFRQRYNAQMAGGGSVVQCLPGKQVRGPNNSVKNAELKIYGGMCSCSKK